MARSGYLGGEKWFDVGSVSSSRSGRGAGVRAGAFAQTGAQLSGVVTDESGGVLPGAEVTVTQTSTGMTQFVITGTQGKFHVHQSAGRTLQGRREDERLQHFEQTGIVLSVGDTRSVNVDAEGRRDDRDDQGAGGRQHGRDAQSQRRHGHEPGTDRRPAAQRPERDAAHPAVGRARSRCGGQTDDRQPAGAVAIAVAGGTGNSTLYLVDGGYNNDPQNNTGNAIPFPDALQEFEPRPAFATRASACPRARR